MLFLLRALRGFAKHIPTVVNTTQTAPSIPSRPNFSSLSDMELALQTRKLLTDRSTPAPTAQSLQQTWLAIQNALVERLTPTINPKRIRSLAMVLYHISKSKHSTLNFETQFAFLLPFATAKSLTTIVNSISRMGGMSPQFRFLAKKQYDLVKENMTVREKVNTNFALVKNGGELDEALYADIESMNLKEIVTLIRMGDMTTTISQERLQKLAHHIALRKNQINLMDLSYSMEIFFKFAYLPEPLEKSINYAYKSLKRNIDEHAFEHIWEYFPKAVNHNLLNIELVQSIILTLKKLYKQERLNPQFVRKVQKDIQKIQNLEVRERCQLK